MFTHTVIEHEKSGNGYQLRFQLLAKNTRLGITIHSGEGAPAQSAVHVYVAVGNDLGTFAHWRQQDQVTAFGIDLLARAYRPIDDLGGRAGGNRSSRC